MKIFLAGLLLFICTSLSAQETFYGIVEYTFTDLSTSENKTSWYPDTSTVIRGRNKMMLKTAYKEKGSSQWVLVDFVTDSIYRIWPKYGIYTKRSLPNHSRGAPKMTRTDSLVNMLGHTCRAYRVNATGTESHGIIWMAEDISAGLEGISAYTAKQIMLRRDIEEKGKPRGYHIATAIKKMDDVPDSFFDISMFREVDIYDLSEEFRKMDITLADKPEKIPGKITTAATKQNKEQSNRLVAVEGSGR